MQQNGPASFSFAEWAKNDAELTAAVQAVQDLPAMSNIVNDFLIAVQDPDWSVRSIASVVARDPAITACVLKVANSSYYSFQRQVSSLEGAISMLGLKTIKSLVLAASVKSMNKRFGLMEKLLLDDSIGCGLAARSIAKKTAKADPEEAFLAGLLRHIGKIAMNNIEREKFALVIQASYNEEDLPANLERKFFTYTHPAIGAALLEKWNFSPRLVAATLFHEEEVQVSGVDADTWQLVDVICVADSVCRKLGIGRRQAEEELEIAHDAKALQLGLDEDAIGEVLEEVSRGFEETRESFSGG
ncbi:MAG: HDOD domain-containing protein [Syntrophotaleaceae bacterium]